MTTLQRSMLVAVTVAVAGCAAPPPPAAGGDRSVRYACDNGQQVEMRFAGADQETAVLVRAGQAVALQRQPSGSGFLYSRGADTVRGKGAELVIESPGAAAVTCQAR